MRLERWQRCLASIKGVRETTSGRIQQTRRLIQGRPTSDTFAISWRVCFALDTFLHRISSFLPEVSIPIPARNVDNLPSGAGSAVAQARNSWDMLLCYRVLMSSSSNTPSLERVSNRLCCRWNSDRGAIIRCPTHLPRQQLLARVSFMSTALLFGIDKSFNDNRLAVASPSTSCSCAIGDREPTPCGIASIRPVEQFLNGQEDGRTSVFGNKCWD